MKRILSGPFRAFSMYALILLIAIVPLFYFALQSIWIQELDERNEQLSQELAIRLQENYLTKDSLNEAITLLNNLPGGIRIHPAEEEEPSRSFSREVVNFADSSDAELFRTRESFIELFGQVYQVQVSANLEETEDTITAIALVVLLFFLLLFGGFLIIYRKSSFKTWKQFRTSLDAIQSFELDSMNPIQLEASQIQEFHELNQALTRLSQNTIEVYRHQNEFIENASHELQTPLALLKTRIDYLMQYAELNPEISEAMQGISGPLQRLIRVNKNLLLLSRVENKQFVEQVEFNFQEILDQTVELITDYAESQEIHIHVNALYSPKLKSNIYLTESLVVNLLMNAIHHSKKSAEVEIKINRDTFEVSNPGSAPLKETELFKRFSRSNNSSIGSGLGLAIIKEICRNNGWNVSYRFENDRHIFRIHFNSKLIQN